jgi:hypothetical protein
MPSDIALDALKQAFEQTSHATEAIGKLFGVTGAYVRQTAKANGWVRSVSVESVRGAEVDWAEAEQLYRINRYTNQEIADKLGCTESTVRVRAKRYKWRRDLTEDINQRAEAKVYQDQHDKKAGRKKADDAIIELEAEVVAHIIKSERSSVSRMRELTERLLNELEIVTPVVTSIADITELKLRQEWTPTSGKLKMFADLMTNAKTLFELERKVHNIKDKVEEKPITGVTVTLTPSEAKL